MNKQEILKQYNKETDRLLIAKVLDKIEFAQTRNKITNTDFLDMYQKNLIKKLLSRLHFTNYIFFGGFEDAERTIAIFYPDKFDENILQKNYSSIMCIIEIVLPNELKGQYSHRNYLGGLMKLGIKREKVGDIVVFDKGAHIIILNEISKYTKTSLAELTRFSKANIEMKNINQIYIQEIKKEEIQIVVSSLRLDNIVSELSKTSRTKAEEIIKAERVLVNFETITKDSKLLKQSDIITVRGKGRFKLLEIIGNTKKGRYIVKVEKYV